ncbi:MAG TPA: hypothetical protein VGE24_09835 [Emticicia sp.]
MKVKRKHVYVIIDKDALYVEYFVIDKPNKYVLYDTLMKSSDSALYVGRRTSLLANRVPLLLFSDEKLLNRRQVALFPMTEKETRNWYRLHNTYYYDLMTSNFDQKLEDFRNNERFEDARILQKEWESLLSNRETLNIEDFKIAVDNVVNGIYKGH